METSRTRYVIGEKEADQISTYCAIARANKSVLRLSELVQLMSIDATEEDLEAAWSENEVLSSRYLLSSGFIVEKSKMKSQQIHDEEINRDRARRNMSVAREFWSRCVDKGIRLFAVSGGNSYQSARRVDDIDFFCVTTADSLWIFMLKSLILARLYRMTRKTPQLCFSYVMDEKKVRKAFIEARDRLFARDALSAQIISGHGFYQSVLGAAEWMSDYFPRMYGYKMREGTGKMERSPTRRGNRVLNSFLFHTVGRYVRIKAFIANEKFRKKRNYPAIFRVKIGMDHCIYESNRYNRLRQMYETRSLRMEPERPQNRLVSS